MNNNLTNKIKMDLYNSYRQINSKDFLSKEFIPYLYSNSGRNDNNNLLSVYNKSTSNLYNTKTELNSNNYVKKSINLNISPSIDNSYNQQKKENNYNLRHYSSFSNHDKNSNKQYEKNKKTLILDLDETLVHSAFTPFNRKSDLILNINIEGIDRTLYVLKRPHVDKFLYELSSLYEIIIFTASISQYANPLLDQLDRNKYIKQRLFRQDCTFSNGIYIKDLKIFNRQLNNMIIIDNNPLSYDNNIDNGIPILSWYEDINDKELLKLLPILKYMSNSNVYDVRTIINQFVNRNTNEIDYIAINRITNINRESEEKENNYLKSNSLTIENKYRKNYKSQDNKKLLNKIENSKKENINYNKKNKNKNQLKSNKAKNYNAENSKILKNKKANVNYNNINIYANYIEEKKDNNYNENINIDKMDPKGIRISIFSPEEYNISYARHFKYSYNTNKISNSNNNNIKLNINHFEEEKFNNTTKIEKNNNNYLLNSDKNQYNYHNLNNKKENDVKSLTPNIDNRRKNESVVKYEDFLNSRKISKKYSLVELTKRALHLVDDETSKGRIKNDYEYSINSNSKNINNLYKNNNYFNKENEIIYKDYINNNKYLSRHKTTNDFTKESDNNDYYFKKISEESKNNNEIFNDKMQNKINSFNERIINTDKFLYNNNLQNNNENNNKNSLLNKINNEKINTFLNVNKINNDLYAPGNNYTNFNSKKNYIQNNTKMNNDNYYKIIKQSLNQNENNLINNKKENNYKKETFQNNNQNNLNNEKIYNNRYDLNGNKENNDNSNINVKYNSISYKNKKRNSLKNLKKSFKKANEQNYEHPLLRTSSYIYSSSQLENFTNNFSLNISYNKENVNNNNYYNLEYGKNLNYKYEIINSQSKSKFKNENEKYSNIYNHNYLKY